MSDPHECVYVYTNDSSKMNIPLKYHYYPLVTSFTAWRPDDHYGVLPRIGPDVLLNSHSHERGIARRVVDVEAFEADVEK